MTRFRAIDTVRLITRYRAICKAGKRGAAFTAFLTTLDALHVDAARLAAVEGEAGMSWTHLTCVHAAERPNINGRAGAYRSRRGDAGEGIGQRVGRRLSCFL